ncbi:unnamed protein product [Owenia fusiformis]|uniref:Uncharacterized protein n=1 Tax=Owenia fusiformis TaxID=6347 RepID=A0A8J1XME6_OWEFU|nr:unnamed protein product [Owenia fusiformis]
MDALNGLRLLLCFTLAKTTYSQSTTDDNYKLIWEENFDSPTKTGAVDRTKWEHETTAWGGGNCEFQVYTPDTTNTYVKDGTLFIKPTLTVNNTNPLTNQPFGKDFLTTGDLDLNAMYGACTMSDNWGCRREGKYGLIPPIMSGRIRTKGRFAFKYGRLEVVAKMPVGDWMWPAIWLLPEGNIYGGWPRSGEIDLVETRGNRDLKYTESGNYAGIQDIGSTLHWGPVWNVNHYHLTTGHHENVTSNYGDHFHTYLLDWDEFGLRFYIDGHEIAKYPDPLINDDPDWTGWWDFGAPWENNETNPWADESKMTPFDQKFHIVMNVAVGSTNGFMPDASAATNGGAAKPYNNSDPDAIVKFWNARDEWYPTWTAEGDNAAMQVKSLKVYQHQIQTCNVSVGTSVRITVMLWAVLLLNFV